MHTTSKETLHTIELFTNIHPKTVSELLNKGRKEFYPAGSYIFRDHDYLSCFYIILSGRVTLYKTNENGQNKIMFILSSGSLLNETIFDPICSTINSQAFEDCELLVYYKEDFILTQNVMNMLSKRVRRLYRQLKNATSTTRIEKKLAAKIWKFGKDYGVPHEKGILINFPITVTALAELLGSYRETVSRALKILIEKELVIYQSKYLIIPNPKALADFFKTS